MTEKKLQDVVDQYEKDKVNNNYGNIHILLYNVVSFLSEA